MSSKDRGTFFSQPETNPKGQVPKNPIEINDLKGKGHEQVKPITTLRSGRQVDNKVEMPKETGDSETNEDSRKD